MFVLPLQLIFIIFKVKVMNTTKNDALEAVRPQVRRAKYDLRRNKEVETLLNRIVEQVDKCVKEPPYSEYQRIARLLELYGLSYEAAVKMKIVEAEMTSTMLNLYPMDYVRISAAINGAIASWTRLTCDVEMFKNRDYIIYPRVCKEDIPQVRESYKWVELLSSGRRCVVEKFDSFDFAYKVYDIILLALNAIADKLNNIFNDYMMLEGSLEMRVKRWSDMQREYMEECWERDKTRYRREKDNHIRKNGYSKRSLEIFLERTDFLATDQKLGLVGELNEMYLRHEQYDVFVFKNRDNLTNNDIIRHLSFVKCRELLVEEIELCDLKQPAVGMYANLFTSRAAQEMAELLVPTMNTYVDFNFDYQYAAWAMAMMDLGLVYPDKRNGVELKTFVNTTFLKNDRQIKNQDSLTKWLNKKLDRRFGDLTEDDLKGTAYTVADYQKLRDFYWLCLSIINQIMQRDFKSLGISPYLYIAHPSTPKLEKYCHQDISDFMARLELLKKAFE